MVDQYAAIAEIVGVILVIASLVCLARQLEQTTAMMRVGAANERVQREYDIPINTSSSFANAIIITLIRFNDR